MMRDHSVNVELQRDGRVFIQPYSKTWEGASIGDGLPSVMFESPEQLGRAVQEAMKKATAWLRRE